MVEVREILCPTDFSEASRHALDHAIAIAKWYVMGVRGRNSLDLTLFGSTTNHVVRNATCPVLTLMQ